MIVIKPGAVSGACRLCFDNLLEQGTVTASSEATDFSVLNCFDWNTADFFQPASSGVVNIDLTLDNPGSANYLAFYAQDLYLNGGSIKLQYFDGTDYVDASDTLFPSDSSPRVLFFDSKTSIQWRVVINCPVVFNIGAISFGTYLPLQYGMYIGWTEPILARNNTISNNISDSGAFLGRSVTAKGSLTNFVLQYASDLWVRTNWLPFVKHAEQKPFFWVPNFAKYPTEAAFCWVEGDFTPPQHTNYGSMSGTFQVRALVE